MFRVGDWLVYTIVVQLTNINFTLVQLFNILLFVLLKFKFSEKVFESEKKFNVSNFFISFLMNCRNKILNILPMIKKHNSTVNNLNKQNIDPNSSVIINESLTQNLSKFDKFKKRIEFFIPFAILIVAAVVLFYRLPCKSMWLDEAYHTTIVRYPIEQLLNKSWIQYNHLHYLINRVSDNIFSDIDFAMKFPEALSAIFLVLFIYLLGKHICSIGTGLLAVVVLLTNPMFVQYAQMNRSYQMAAVFVIATYYFFARLMQTGQWKFWVGYVIMAVCLLRTQSLGPPIILALLIPFITIVIDSLILKKRAAYRITWSLILKLFAAAIAIGVLWLPYTIRILSFSSEKDVGASYFGSKIPAVSIQGVIDYSANAFVKLGKDCPPHWIYYALAVLALIGVLIYRKHKGLHFLAFGFASSMVIFYILNKTNVSIFPKRVLFMLPMFVLFMSCGVVSGARICGDSIYKLICLLSILFTKYKLIVFKAATLIKIFVVIVAWVFIFRIAAWPVLSKGAYNTITDFFNERVNHKALSRLLTVAWQPDDELWIYPVYRPPYCLRIYLPSFMWIKPIEKVGNPYKELKAKLNQGKSVWLHNIKPNEIGIPESQIIVIPYNKSTTCIVRPQYSNNQVACKREEESLLQAQLSLSPFPDTYCANRLIERRLNRGATNEANQVAKYIGSFSASRKAVVFASSYYGKRFMRRQIQELWYKYANIFFWRPNAQTDAALIAIQYKKYEKAIRFAKRLRWWIGDPKGANAFLAGKAYFLKEDYPNARKWLMRSVKAGHKKDAEFQSIINYCNDMVEAFDIRLLHLQEWTKYGNLNNMHSIISELSPILKDENIVQAFNEQKRNGNSNEKMLSLITSLVNTNKIPADIILKKSCELVNYYTWPVHIFVLQQLDSTNYTNSIVVSAGKLKNIGFDTFSEMSDANILWFEQYYRKYGTINDQFSFYDSIIKDNPERRWWGILQKCRALVKKKDYETAIKLINNNINNIVSSNRGTYRIIELLETINSEQSRSVKKKLIQQKNNPVIKGR